MRWQSYYIDEVRDKIILSFLLLLSFVDTCAHVQARKHRMHLTDNTSILSSLPSTMRVESEHHTETFDETDATKIDF